MVTHSEENFLAPKARCPWPTPGEAVANPEFVERLGRQTKIFSDVKEVSNDIGICCYC